MIDSSVLAGTNSMRGSTLILAGAVGVTPVAAGSDMASTAGIAGVAGRDPGDGFRERFEASVGLTPGGALAGGRSDAANVLVGSRPAKGTASPEAATTLMGASTSAASGRFATEPPTDNATHEAVSSDERSKRVEGEPAKAGGLPAAGAGGEAVDGALQLRPASPGSPEMSPVDEPDAPVLGAVKQESTDVRDETASASSGTVAELAGVTVSATQKAPGSGVVDAALETKGLFSGTTGGVGSRLRLSAPLRPEAPKGTSHAILEGSVEETAGTQVSAGTGVQIGRKLAAPVHPVLAGANEPAAAVTVDSQTTLMSGCSEEGAGAAAVAERAVPEVSARGKNGGLPLAVKAANAATATEGHRKKAGVSSDAVGDAVPPVTLAGTNALPLSGGVAAPVAVALPSAAQETGRDLETRGGAGDSTKGAGLRASDAVGQRPLASAQPVSAPNDPASMQDVARGFGRPLAREQTPVVSGAADGTPPRSVEGALPIEARPVSAKKESVALDPAITAKEAEAPTLQGQVSDTRGVLYTAAVDVALKHVTGQTALTVAVEAPVPAVGERKGSATKAMSAVRGTSTMAVTNDTSPVTATAGLVSALPPGGERADGTVGAKAANDLLSGAKEGAQHPSIAVPESGASVVVMPTLHAEALGEKAPDAALQGPTASTRGAEYPGMANAGEGFEHTTLVATPNVLEVGVSSGTNGWLKVRAEMDGTGGVAASVVATTASATEALHKELPSLSAYLRDESVGVSSLVVHRAEAGTMTHDSTASFGGSGFGTGSQPGRGGQPSTADAPVRQDSGGGGIEAILHPVVVDSFSGGAPVTGYGPASGGRLNVVA